jgi:hypothetical protein
LSQQSAAPPLAVQTQTASWPQHSEALPEQRYGNSNDQIPGLREISDEELPGLRESSDGEIPGLRECSDVEMPRLRDEATGEEMPELRGSSSGSSSTSFSGVQANGTVSWPRMTEEENARVGFRA